MQLTSIAHVEKYLLWMQSKLIRIRCIFSVLSSTLGNIMFLLSFYIFRFDLLKF